MSEEDCGSELTIDHYRPRSHGGGDGFDNLVYCCHMCNAYKGKYWSDQPSKRLLHPMRDELDAHITVGSNGVLQGLTERGAFHIGRLQLNRPELVSKRIRDMRRDAAIRARDAAMRELETVEQELGELTDKVRTARRYGSYRTRRLGD